MDQMSHMLNGEKMNYEHVCSLADEIKQEELLRQRKQLELFQLIGGPSVITAFILTFCLFKNYSSIMMIFAVASLTGYVYYDAKKCGKIWKKSNWLCVFVMGLLAVSDFLTADKVVIVCNNIGIFLMFGLLVMRTFLGDVVWNLHRGIHALKAMLLSIFTGGTGIKTGLKLSMKEDKKTENKNMQYIIIGALIAIPIIVITGALLGSADEMFGKIFREMFERMDFDFGTCFWIVIMFLMFANILYGTMQYVSDRNNLKALSEKKQYEAVVAITVLVPMAIMYVVFSMMQLLFLFGGALPESYDYASYARTGFFQLLAVCIINLIMVLVVQSNFKENKVVKWLLAIVSGCTYVMLASSAYRMILYVQAYNLTRLRILVLWALVLIAVLFVGVVTRIFKTGFPLLKYMIVSVSICYLFLSFSHMDYYIVKYNTYAGETYGVSVDYDYLNKLSMDAADAIREFDEQILFRPYFERMNDEADVSIRTFNLSRYKAHKIKNKHDEIMQKIYQ